jgi:serpin B
MKQTLQLVGLTEEEINQSYRSLIDLLTTLDPKVVFQIANSIWYRDTFPISQSFIDLNQEYFDAEVTGLDFNNSNAANIINQWVSANTNGRIDSIVDPPIDALTVMILINAIYFKGDWTYKFDTALTANDQFTLPDGSTKQIPMMNQDEGTFPYFENDDFQAVDLAYGDSLFSMTIILPKPGIDLDAMIASLDKATWEGWVNQLYPQEFAVLQMPRFELEYEVKLNDILSTLGMEIAFDPNNANFSRMRDGTIFLDNLYISGVKHKTYVKVDEDGTEAAAVTSVTVGATSVPVNIVMRINRPFIFVIKERFSGTILFIGKVVDPAP